MGGNRWWVDKSMRMMRRVEWVRVEGGDGESMRKMSKVGLRVSRGWRMEKDEENE